MIIIYYQKGSYDSSTPEAKNTLNKISKYSKALILKGKASAPSKPSYENPNPTNNAKKFTRDKSHKMLVEILSEIDLSKSDLILLDEESALHINSISFEHMQIAINSS